ncbi:hypothetical protein [Pararhizobium sp. DWP1-1-3]|uniref:hypothetical protein n=1 Tax=Pararhizobium sp. DWP1-1-3 TaxID=2804652 RepID=UPI003CF0649F
MGDCLAAINDLIIEGETFGADHLRRILVGGGIAEDQLESVTNFMLYYGFLGVTIGASAPKFIFDVACDMKLIV